MPLSPKKKRNQSWPGIWFKDPQALKNVILKKRLNSLSSTSNTPPSEPDETETLTVTLEQESPPNPDYTSLLSDELLLIILSKLPHSCHTPNSLVCKRWFRLSGGLVSSIRVLDWDFLESGRLVYRFPNLNEVDVVRACVKSPRNSGILLSNKFVSVCVDSRNVGGGFVVKKDLLGSDLVDVGLRILAEGCRDLRKLVVIGASEEGLLFAAEKCLILQELELHSFSDWVLKGVTRFQNLQIVKSIGCIEGFYDSVITDIGLTILAQGCRRLLKLELVGCEGSYDGVKAIGQCCQMLEELTLCDHRLDGGWRRCRIVGI